MFVQTTPAMFLDNPYRLLIPGQWIRSHNGTVWHHGIVTGFARDFATNTPVALVAHNRPIIGVAETSLQEFATNHIEIYRQPVSDEHAQAVVAFARANLNKPYALFNQNCEHFASFCFTLGKAESEQVQAVVAVVAVAGVAALMMRSTRA
jgi:hypothetical protein